MYIRISLAHMDYISCLFTKHKYLFSVKYKNYICIITVIFVKQEKIKVYTVPIIFVEISVQTPVQISTGLLSIVDSIFYTYISIVSFSQTTYTFL